MRELTMQELDSQVAEQLPARELMGSTRGCGYPAPHQSSGNHVFVNRSNIGNSNSGLVAVQVNNTGDIASNNGQLPF